MNVLLLSQFFSSTRGGGEYLFYIIAESLANNNHQVWIITNKIEDEKYALHKNIKIIFVPPILKYQGGLPPSISDNIKYLWNGIQAGVKVVKQNNIDIIHSNNFTPAFVGSILSLLTSKKHVTSVWDIFTLCGSDYWKRWTEQTGISKINQYIGPIFEKLSLKIKCDAFHTISNASKNDLIKFGAKKPIYVIPPTIKKIKLIENTSNNKQFIFLGRLVFYKNIEVLIKAIKIVKIQDDEIKLFIVGGGPQLERIQSIITNHGLQNNIIVKGYVDTKEKFELVSQSNALLFPSVCEGFGLVILEAFSQKKPVLVSNIGPMSEIIEHEKTGYVLDSDDENIWAEHIIRLAKNFDESKQMGENGNKVLKSRYNLDVMYEKLIQMYSNIL
ncbi:MAG: glycosyltransferase family 4 protein [Nitrosopumilus sp.]|nr:glycosyltransferase family 4 protein [Nitrosopumilus sp.]MDH3501140.1 glycosyltransferase family 4 protein [Nitrosopumilus sp.]